MARLGYLDSDEVAQIVVGTGAVQVSSPKLTGFAGLPSTLGLVEQTGVSAYAIRHIGAASVSDILDRASADTRYASSSSTGSSVYTGTAGATISGHTAVYVSTTDGKVYPAVPDATSRFCIGVTTGGAASGAAVTVQVSGVLTEPTWAWTMAQPVWLGASGALTQTQPTTGALFQIGIPLGATALRVEPLLLALLS